MNDNMNKQGASLDVRVSSAIKKSVILTVTRVHN